MLRIISYYYFIAYNIYQLGTLTVYRKVNKDYVTEVEFSDILCCDILLL